MVAGVRPAVGEEGRFWAGSPGSDRGAGRIATDPDSRRGHLSSGQEFRDHFLAPWALQAATREGCQPGCRTRFSPKVRFSDGFWQPG